MVKVTKNGVTWYMDEHLCSQLDKVTKRVNQKDEDYFFVVDGEEGAGKSVKTLQMACYVDPTFSLDRIVFNPEDFKKAIISAKKGQAVVFDEAFRGLSSRGSLSAINKLLVQLMMECRQKNLIVFVVMPTFFLLEKYVALWRAKGLFHVYRRNGVRGRWMFFNKKGKRLLYLHGMKNYYSYKFPKSNFKGRFTNNYVWIDEEAYRAKKKDALEDSLHEEPIDKFQLQRDMLFWLIKEKLSVNNVKVASLLTENGWKVSNQTVSNCVNRAKKVLGLGNEKI